LTNAIQNASADLVLELYYLQKNIEILSKFRQQISKMTCKGHSSNDKIEFIVYDFLPAFRSSYGGIVLF